MRIPYEIERPEDLLSPSLLVFRDTVRENIETMIGLAGSADRLRPHAKTHKMPAMIRLLESFGIGKHKCATIAEAEMIAEAGGRDVLIAYPLVGPNTERLAALVDRFPDTTFRTAVDDFDSARALSRAMTTGERPLLPVLVDLDVGMGRTGIDPSLAFDLYRRIHELPGLVADGLQAYDGHLRDADPECVAWRPNPASPRCGTSEHGWNPRACPCRGSSSEGRRRSRSTPARETPGSRRLRAPASSTTPVTPRSSPTCRSGRPPCC